MVSTFFCRRENEKKQEEWGGQDEEGGELAEKEKGCWGSDKVCFKYYDYNDNDNRQFYRQLV